MLFELRVRNSYGVENGIDACGGTCRSDSITQVRCTVFEKRLIGSKIPSQAFFGASDHTKRLASLCQLFRQCFSNRSRRAEKSVRDISHLLLPPSDVFSRISVCFDFCFEFWRLQVERQRQFSSKAQAALCGNPPFARAGLHG